MRYPALTLAIGIAMFPCAIARAALFDFDTAPLHSPLPVTLTTDSLTATFSGTGDNFSIQTADVLGFTPAGFSGYCVYPNSIFPMDLQIAFSEPLSGISVLYADNETGTDVGAIMRITGYMNNVQVATDTHQSQPGTWPSGTLSLNSVSPFDHVVVHYDTHPPGPEGWGPNFMVDNVNATVAVPEIGSLTAISIAALLLVRRRQRA